MKLIPNYMFHIFIQKKTHFSWVFSKLGTGSKPSHNSYKFWTCWKKQPKNKKKSDSA